MNVLVTGGAGFIGVRLARALLQQGHSVTILDNFSPQIHGSNTKLPADLSRSVRLVHGDVRNEAIWASTVPGHQVIVHLAAETGTGQSMYEVAKYEQVNLSGTALLYDLLTRNSSYGVERIVVASSRAIYGEGAYQCQEHGQVYPQPRASVTRRKASSIPYARPAGGPASLFQRQRALPFSPRRFTGLPSRCRSK